MISSEELIAVSKKGCNVRVEKNTEDHREIVIFDGGRRAERNIEIDRDEYEHLMTETVSQLLARNGADLKVRVGGDFYGRLWVEVRSGFFSHRLSRLGLSPRHINLLREGLSDRGGRDEAA
jgi:hypothetical protein